MRILQRRFLLGAVEFLLIYVIVCTILGYLSTVFENWDPDYRYYNTPAASKANGNFVADATPTPRTLFWNDQRVTIGEAWFQRPTRRVHTYVFVPFLVEYKVEQDAPWFALCLTFSECPTRFDHRRHPMLVKDGVGCSIGKAGMCFFPVGPEHMAGVTILLTDSFQFDNGQKIHFKKS